MKSIGFAAVGLLLFSQTAGASPSWTVFSLATTPGNAQEVIAAADKLMDSSVGKEFPGRLLLQVNLANGADPTTHSFIPLFKAAAEQEAFAQKLRADIAWKEFQATMTELAQPVAQVMYSTVKSWGHVNNTDSVWVGYAFDVSRTDAFLAALDKLMTSETGKNAPAQVHLSDVVAGGITPVNQVISVGYASRAEMETWNDSLRGNTDWNTYIDEANKSGKYLGATLSRTLKVWGSASLSDVTGR
jgi:hypothetical protein